MSKLLMRYLRLAVQEAHLVRVPNQLVSDDGQEGQDDSDDQTELDEFCGVGGGNVVGYNGLLGGGKAKHPRASVDPRKRRK
jgi:hypothetical protein